MSPFPTSFSAPGISIITLESVLLVTLKAILQGMLALINPVTTFVEGPDYKEEILKAPQNETSIIQGGEATDDLFDEAVQTVVEAKKGSASLLQRRLSIGYARAARILDELEAAGIVGPAQGSKARDVYPPQEQPPEPGPNAPSLSP